jgi:large subunit ribosomal protein L19e
MDTSYQKRLAAKILKCSPKRVHVAQEKDIEEALTRNDVRHLVVKGLISKKRKKGSSRVKANFIASQKKKGRGKGPGKRSGTKRSRLSKKDVWMRNLRAQRVLLRELRDGGRIDKGVYGSIYKRSKGGEFRNKKHMLAYMRDNGLLKGTKKGGADA